MKAFVLFIVLATTFSALATPGTKIPKEQILKYQDKEESSIQVGADFAHHLILNENDVKRLEGKRIYHIEQVYTQYRQSPDFDQEALNQRRREQLLELLPQIKTDHPTWKLLEQTGAKTRNQARTYFHGFVLYYSDELNYKDLESFFEPQQVSFTEYIGNNIRENVFHHPTETIITVHQDAVIDKDSNLVQGDYIIKYREFRNTADIAYSGIPMNYTENGVSYNFSSVGMYEIRAEQNGKPLSLIRPAVIDFNCTEVAEGVNFYQMDDSGNWREIQQVDFRKNDRNQGGGARKDHLAPEFVNDQEFPRNFHFRWNWSIRSVDSTAVQAKFANNTWRRVHSKMRKDDYWNEHITEMNVNERSITVAPQDSLRLTKLVNSIHVLWWGPVLMNARRNRHRKFNKGKTVERDGKSGTLLAEGANEGHTYPTVVRGLNSDAFGVYNCDQIYRIGSPVSLAPKYIDSESGEEIKRKHVACVLDLNYRGSFSFHPENLTLNVSGKNVILLFTSDKKTYMIENDGIKEACASNNPAPVLRMKDMTKELKSSDDLKKLLKL